MTPYLHNLDPFAIRFFGDVGVRWYGIAYVAGFVVAFLLIRRVLRNGASPLVAGAAADLVAVLALGAVLGGRLGYIAFYQPSLLWTFSDDLPFWNALAINRGGMASHGGMIGVVVAALVFARRRRVPFLHVVDLAAFSAPIGLFFGRLANFVNGELYGRAAPAGLAWAVKFPTEMRTWGVERVTAMQEALVRVGAPALAVDDVIRAVQSGDARVTSAITPLLTARHPSQIYEALLEGALLFAIVAVVWSRARKPGVVAATFGGAYAAVRIFGEQFRLPDAPLFSVAALDVSLTRGQALSVVLLFGAVLVAVGAARGGAMKLGGWRRAAVVVAAFSRARSGGSKASPTC